MLVVVKMGPARTEIVSPILYKGVAVGSGVSVPSPSMYRLFRLDPIAGE